jgi:hypothetical protein
MCSLPGGRRAARAHDARRARCRPPRRLPMAAARPRTQ